MTGFLRGKSKKLELPVSCYLIEHPMGKVLIDTGWDSKYATERSNYFLNSISRPVIKQDESVHGKS